MTQTSNSGDARSECSSRAPKLRRKRTILNQFSPRGNQYGQTGMPGAAAPFLGENIVRDAQSWFYSGRLDTEHTRLKSEIFVEIPGLIKLERAFTSVDRSHSIVP